MGLLLNAITDSDISSVSSDIVITFGQLEFGEVDLDLTERGAVCLDVQLAWQHTSTARQGGVVRHGY